MYDVKKATNFIVHLLCYHVAKNWFKNVSRFIFIGCSLH